METVFLSYSWENEDYADEIDNIMQSIGIEVIRDKRKIGYKGSIKEYMKSIRRYDWALILISDDYLKSEACMFEIHELMKDEDYLDKILPIILPRTNIFKAEEQVKYLKYWKKRVEELESLLENLESTQSIPLIEQLQERKNVQNCIIQFLKGIAGRNIPPYEQIKIKDFKVIKDYLGIEDNLKSEIISAVSGSSTPEESEIRIEELEKEFPNRYEIYVAKGHNEFLTHRYLKAQHSYQKAIDLNSNNASAWYNLGCMQELNKDYSKAIESFKKSIELDKSNARAYNNLANLLKEYRPEKSEGLYRKAISLNPHSDEFQYNLGLLYSEQKLYEKALNQYDKTIDINPENESAWINKAITYEELEDYSKSIEAFNRVLDVNPHNSKALLRLAKIYEEHEIDLEQARRCYETYLAIERQDIVEHKAYFLFLNKHFKEDERKIEEVLHYISFLEEKEKREK